MQVSGGGSETSEIRAPAAVNAVHCAARHTIPSDEADIRISPRCWAAHGCPADCFAGVWILALLALLVSAAGALGQSSDGADGSTCSSDSDCDSSSVCTVFEGLATGTCTQKGQLMSRCDDAAPCVSTDFLQLQCLQGFCLPSEDSGTPSQTIPAGGTCAIISNTQTCVENYFCNPLSLKCESATVASCTLNGNECAAGQICVPISTDQGGDGTTGSCITIGGSDQCSPECGDQEQW